MSVARAKFLRKFAHLLLALLLLGVAKGADVADFVATNILRDGEIEITVHYHGVTAKETRVGRTNHGSVKLRQLSDGKHLIQLIYDQEDALQDCEFLHEKREVHKFIREIKEDLRDLLDKSNLTIVDLDGRDLPAEIANWFDFSRLKRTCKRRHEEMRDILGERNGHRNGTRWTESNAKIKKKRDVSDYLIAPGTLWCGHADAAKIYTDLGGMFHTDKCCRKHDHCQHNIPGFSKRYNHYNLTPFTLSHCWCDSRSKRSIADYLRVPGTKWCGKGFSAAKYTQLGGFSRTDKCCRKHDTACPFWIAGFENKYGLFNWRINTIMHCSCDERFRTCLKMLDTSDANLVGKLFFNVVQTKCFVLKPKKICVKRSWWGKCTKMKYMKQAVLRDNLPF